MPCRIRNAEPDRTEPAESRSRYRYRSPRNHESPIDLPVVRPLQPHRLRAAVCADRRAAGAASSAPRSRVVDAVWRLLWIVVAMVAARSAAMGFNRLVDARFDAKNPRTAMRELPRGAMTAARRRCSSSSRRSSSSSRRAQLGRMCFAAVAGRAGDRVLVLAGQALHHATRSCSSRWRWRWRRSAAGSRPAAAVGASSRGCSALAIGTWVGGFDILYACQDLEFDRAHGLALDSGALRRARRRC